MFLIFLIHLIWTSIIVFLVCFSLELYKAFSLFTPRRYHEWLETMPHKALPLPFGSTLIKIKGFNFSPFFNFKCMVVHIIRCNILHNAFPNTSMNVLWGNHCMIFWPWSTPWPVLSSLVWFFVITHLEFKSH